MPEPNLDELKALAEETKPGTCANCGHVRRSVLNSGYTGHLEPGYLCTRNGKRTAVGPGWSCWRWIEPEAAAKAGGGQSG